MPQEQTIEYKGVKIVIRERLNEDMFNEIAVKTKLDVESADYRWRRDWFTNCVLQTVSIEGLPFEWPTMIASREAIVAAYQAWCAMNPKLGEKWTDAIYQLNKRADDDDLAPKVAMGE
jgi:hypothetical protein